MIRTLAEVHADRVTVTVTLDTEVSETDRADANKAWAERAEARVAELERSLAASVKREEETEAELEKRPTFGALRDAINGKDLALGELQTVRAELERSRIGTTRLLENTARRVSAAVEFLTAGAVAEARENIVTSRGAVLADAIGNALRVLDKA